MFTIRVTVETSPNCQIKQNIRNCVWCVRVWRGAVSMCVCGGGGGGEGGREQGNDDDDDDVCVCACGMKLHQDI